MTANQGLRWPAQPRILVGAVCWLMTGLYFAAEVVVAAAWPEPYSFWTNTISDLGVVNCGELVQFGGAPVRVCSPWHAAMNAAFVAAGLLTAAGAVLTRAVWPRRRSTRIGVTFVVLAGIGGVLVGLAPADVNLPVHAAGALLQLPGAAAPLVLGLTVRVQQPALAWISSSLGALGVLASVLYFAQLQLGLGAGVLERLAIWPLTVWTFGVGAFLLSRSRPIAP